MKYNKLEIPESTTSKYGLDVVELSRLPNLVVLVGKNGAGKTRFFNCIKEYTSNLLSWTEVVKSNIVGVELEISGYENALNGMREAGKLLLQVSKINHEINNIRATEGGLGDEEYIDIKNLEGSKSEIDRKAKNLRKRHQPRINIFDGELKKLRKLIIKHLEFSEIQSLKDALSKQLENNDFESIVDKSSQGIESNELQSIKESSLIYLSKLPHRLVGDYLDCFGDSEKFSEYDSYKKYTVLKKCIKSFLNKELSYEKIKSSSTIETDRVLTESRGKWLLNKKDFDYDKFSSGEKTLFAFALYFFLHEINPSRSISQSIVLIDEPELHLHPEAQIQVIKSLKSIIGEKGQIWISTHSIPIVSTSEYNEIFIVKDGKVIPPNRKNPTDAIDELLSTENYLQNLTDYISSISNWMYTNFIVECFNDPEVIRESGGNDPQVLLFIEHLSKKPNQNILDFGAGEGRILKALNESNKYKSQDKYNIDAYDINDVNKNILLEIGYNNFYSKLAQIQNEIYDAVLLCNVLHEIPILEWVKTLNKIISSIKEEGYLIIIEVNELIKGEYIDQAGFLISSLGALKKLFNINGTVTPIIHKNERYRDRILCCPINKRQMKKITKKNVIEACEFIRDDMFNKIDDLRKHDSLLQTEKGRKGAFYSQQYINATRGIKILNNDG